MVKIQQRKLKAHTIKTIILDEVDSLLSGNNVSVIKDIIKTKPNNNNTNDYTLPVNYNVHLSEFMLNTMMKAETKIEEMKVREDAGRELINKIMINLGWECTENEMNKLMNNGYGKLLLINKIVFRFKIRLVKALQR